MKYSIVKIINSKTNNDVCKYYLNKEIDMLKSIIQESKPLMIVYKDGCNFIHEKVISIQMDTFNSIIVYTVKKIWFIKREVQ